MMHLISSLWLVKTNLFMKICSFGLSYYSNPPLFELWRRYMTLAHRYLIKSLAVCDAQPQWWSCPQGQLFRPIVPWMNLHSSRYKLRNLPSQPSKTASTMLLPNPAGRSLLHTKDSSKNSSKNPQRLRKNITAILPSIARRKYLSFY